MDSTRLAHYRDRAEAKLPDTLSIERRSLEPDGALGQTETITTVATEVPCLVVEMGSGRTDREYELAGMVRGEGNHLVRMPIDTAVQSSDVLVWDGHRLEVNRIASRSYATLLSVQCVEVT